ncbi:aldose 1-epimerase family protein [Botrimarina sp.]|uniref:aldose 1-epimerase family protein n=1 Tax=Botrimarina sp. TaxID=2795802 RepID=UPI0032EB947B
MQRVLIDSDSDVYCGPFTQRVGGPDSPCEVGLRRLRGGVSDGVEVLSIKTPRLKVEILPTRGMSVWRAEADGIPLGWRSPLGRPVHPRHVSTSEPGGLGFLDGPTELLFRCGLGNAGTPDFDERGRLRYPLHGRIANLPADYLAVEADPETRLTTVVGRVVERRFLRQKLALTTRMTLPWDGAAFDIHDEVVNLSATPATMQVIYHTNLGEPFLREGATIHAAAERVCPRDRTAADAGVETWNRMPPADASSWEQVFFVTARPAPSGETRVVVAQPDGEAAVALSYNVDQLPCFTLWRNTQASEDGYVVGIEPGTNFPNPFSFEEARERLVRLAPHGVWETSLRLEGFAGRERVDEAIAAVRALQANRGAQLLKSPCPEWAPAE